MSEFKYACPHCGQHIRCDAAQAGSTMECPTCFQKIIAPQAPEGEAAKFILTGIKIPKHARPIGEERLTTANAPVVKTKFPIAAVVGAVVVVAVVAAAVMFRGKIFKPAPAPVPVVVAPVVKPVAAAPVAPPVSAPPANDPNWKLDLAGVKLPDVPVAGRLNGQEFTCQRATLLGGSLAFRQGNRWPPDLGLHINLHVAQGAELAGKNVHIAVDLAQPPKVTLRWRDAQQEPAAREFTGGYAMRIEFGALAGDRLPGKIYLCLPDDQKSYIAGSFTAEILKPKTSGKTTKRKP